MASKVRFSSVRSRAIACCLLLLVMLAGLLPGGVGRVHAQAGPGRDLGTGWDRYLGLRLGEMTKRGVVRSAPSSAAAAVKNWWVGRRVLLYETLADEKGGLWYRVSEPPEEPMYIHASLARPLERVKFEPGHWKDKWINVNVSQQIVTAYEGSVPVKVTLTSTGKARTPTELGVQKITWRTTSQRMRGGTPGVDYYDLPNVPYPQYFNDTGEALHGTYWHDNFGYPMSHGCVNLSTPMSRWLYEWARIGTIVYVHY